MAVNVNVQNQVFNRRDVDGQIVEALFVKSQFCGAVVLVEATVNAMCCLRSRETNRD